MRYYIYLDKEFLRSLFAIFNKAEFNIDVFEFSVRNSYTLNNNVSIDPSFERAKDSEDFKKKDWKDNYTSTARDTNAGRNRVGVSYDNGNSYNYQTERKYLNIADITDMKNMAFYHDILEKIKENVYRDEDSRICCETGFVKLNKIRESEESSDDKFFMVNNSFVWYDSTKLQGNINLIQEMSCKICVIGYKMNCKDEQLLSNNILKAIAIYIEWALVTFSAHFTIFNISPS